MSDFQRPSLSDFANEYQRLLGAQAIARGSGDPETIDAADAEMAHFLRMNAVGRLQEYFNSRERTNA